jgi:hypothetical protein
VRSHKMESAQEEKNDPDEDCHSGVTQLSDQKLENALIPKEISNDEYFKKDDVEEELLEESESEDEENERITTTYFHIEIF